MRLYPDRLILRVGYALADALTLIWLVLWVKVAEFIYNTVMALTVVAQSITHAGEVINALIVNFQVEAQHNIPFIGDWLASLGRQFNNAGGPFVQFGGATAVAIHNLAVALALLIGGPPLLAGLLTYVPWRWTHTREFSSLHTVIRRVPAPDEAATLQVLAARALYTLPFHVLLQYSRNPIQEFAAGKYENLARATMAQQGLDLDRYIAPAALPEPSDEPPLT